MKQIAQAEPSSGDGTPNLGVSLDNLGATISIEQAAKLLGIGRGLAYRLASSGQMPGVLSLGRRLRVSVPALRRALLADVEDEG